ncbi:MAG TPA: hypothetical protein VEQ18_03835 [Candidatus Nitrosocosmicus sp.]|nr:hypothetical protein [Candidatus Nitrosocosmicus sp.]
MADAQKSQEHVGYSLDFLPIIYDNNKLTYEWLADKKQNASN